MRPARECGQSVAMPGLRGTAKLEQLHKTPCCPSRPGQIGENSRTKVQNVDVDSTAGLGRFDEAEPLLLRSFELIQAEKSAGPDYKQAARRRIVAMYEAWGKLDKAAEYRFASPSRQSDPS